MRSLGSEVQELFCFRIRFAAKSHGRVNAEIRQCHLNFSETINHAKKARKPLLWFLTCESVGTSCLKLEMDVLDTQATASLEDLCLVIDLVEI